MRRTVTYRNFEWDREKAWKNLAKHRIAFEEAVTVFDDPFFFAYKDLKHSVQEDCYVIIGMSRKNRLLTVALLSANAPELSAHANRIEMKRNSTKKKVAKQSELDQIDPLNDIDVRKLKLVARGRGWATNPEVGKRRARSLDVPNEGTLPVSRKRKRA